MSQDTTKEIGLKETKELHGAICEILDDVKESKADDGKVSTMEWMKIAMENAGDAVEAFQGVDQIDDELTNLDADEVKEVAYMGVILMKKFAETFFTGNK